MIIQELRKNYEQLWETYEWIMKELWKNYEIIMNYWIEKNEKLWKTRKKNEWIIKELKYNLYQIVRKAKLKGIFLFSREISANCGLSASNYNWQWQHLKKFIKALSPCMHVVPRMQCTVQLRDSYFTHINLYAMQQTSNKKPTKMAEASWNLVSLGILDVTSSHDTHLNLKT